jgi:hypothetical protein
MFLISYVTHDWYSDVQSAKFIFLLYTCNLIRISGKRVAGIM